MIKENFKKEFGCVLVNYEFPELSQLQQAIDKEDIYDEPHYGLENEPHVTLLFGLHRGISKEQVLDKVGALDFVTCTVSDVSFFRNNVFDVLKFKAFNNNFYRANQKLKELPNTQNFPDYSPHMTLAYLKAGRADEYVKLFKGYSQILGGGSLKYSLPE